MTWIHSCLAIDSTLNHLTIVANGKKLEDKAFPIPAGAQPPSNLTGKLLVFKAYIGFWYQSKNKVSNLNIFSKLLTLPEMVRRTAGEDCGKADGDYLDWESSDWDLKGKTSLGEVNVEELCRRESRIQLFTVPIGQLDQCKNLCAKMETGTIASVRTLSEAQKMFERVDEVLNTDGKPTKAGKVSQAAWASIRRAEDGSWIDLLNKDPVKEIVWAEGQPKPEPCAIFVIPWRGLASWQCSAKSAYIYCPCFFPVH